MRQKEVLEVQHSEGIKNLFGVVKVSRDFKDFSPMLKTRKGVIKVRKLEGKEIKNLVERSESLEVPFSALLPSEVHAPLVPGSVLRLMVAIKGTSYFSTLLWM